MLLGAIADDFTGASDLANTLARGGMAAVQYVGVPNAPAGENVEAGIVALKSRSIPAEEAVRLSLEALDWLRGQGCRQVIFKYCSTFDSTPEGNIGPVGEALAERLGVKGVVVCPAFPTTGRTLYQGHLFVGDALLSESGLENHPLNPMTDPDIRRWLAFQTTTRVGHVPLAVVRTGAAAIRASLDDQGRDGRTLVVVDAVADDDLVAIGHACAQAPLLTGGSGIALGLPDNFRAEGSLGGTSGAWESVSGPAAILSGSCSRATLEQIERHAAAHPSLAIAPDALMAGEITPEHVSRFLLENAGDAPLAYSSAAPERVRAAQEEHGGAEVAARLEALFADIARRVVEGGVTRLVVAGGETSSAVVEGLALESLAIGPEIDPGVPALRVTDRPLTLALKSGNFGAPDFFAKATQALGGGHG